MFASCPFPFSLWIVCLYLLPFCILILIFLWKLQKLEYTHILNITLSRVHYFLPKWLPFDGCSCQSDVTLFLLFEASECCDCSRPLEVPLLPSVPGGMSVPCPNHCPAVSAESLLTGHGAPSSPPPICLQLYFGVLICAPSPGSNYGRFMVCSRCWATHFSSLNVVFPVVHFSSARLETFRAPQGTVGSVKPAVWWGVQATRRVSAGTRAHCLVLWDRTQCFSRCCRAPHPRPEHLHAYLAMAVSQPCLSGSAADTTYTPV